MEHLRTILYVTYCDPESVDSGNAQRTHLIYEALKKIGRVYTIQLVETDAGRIREDFYRCIPIPLCGWRKRVNQLVHHLLLWPTRGLVEGYYPFSLRLGVDDCFPGVKFDCVVKRYLSKLGSIHLWDIAPLYVDIDDHPLEVYQTVIRPKIGWRHWHVSILHRLYLWLVERHVTGGWVANASQTKWSCFRTPTSCLPNLPTMPSASYQVGAARANYIFSIGLMAYQANYNGVDRFVTEIWPRIYAEFPMLNYYICGKGTPAELSRKWALAPGVKVLGFVKDIEGLYAHALATVAPIDQGGGTCLKTLESMSHSRICLSTPFGARGLPAVAIRDKTCGVLIYETAEELIAHIRDFVLDEARRGVVERAGLTFLRGHYSISAFENSVRTALGCA